MQKKQWIIGHGFIFSHILFALKKKLLRICKMECISKRTTLKSMNKTVHVVATCNVIFNIK